MIKIKSIIIDDEQDSREILKLLLKNHQDKIEICGEATNANEAFSLISGAQPDLVFLDIRMPGEDGFSLLKKFERIDFEVIFVTSFDQYAINAIKFNALDYLLKPIDIDELAAAITKAGDRIENKISNSLQIVSLMDYLENDSHKKIPVHKGDKVKMLQLEKIMYIESDGRYCTLTMEDHEKHLLSKSLKDIETYLGPETYFIRINKSVMVNTNFIKGYSKQLPYLIEMTDQAEFEIPRRKKTEVLEKLKMLR